MSEEVVVSIAIVNGVMLGVGIHVFIELFKKIKFLSNRIKVLEEHIENKEDL